MKHGGIYLLLIMLAAGGALAVRLPQLQRRPMHADEAVQAARFRDWWQTGIYVYDPNEYHGPTLIYATLPSVMVGGSATFADTSAATYRVVPVFFGAGMVFLFWLLRDALGRAGLLWAAILVGCSPACVFYSRYYIHETLLAFFTLAAIACGWRYVQSGRVAWCVGLGVALGCMQATKETAAIAYLAAAVAWTAIMVVPARRDPQSEPPSLWRGWHLALSAMVAVLVATTLLSSFFTNPRGAIDGVLTYVPWLSRAGGESPHNNPWYFYLQRLVWWRADNGPLWSEALIVGLAVTGFMAGLLQKPQWLGGAHAGFVRSLGYYTLTVTAIYSVIPYKTPWCLLQFLLGMVLLAGVGAAVMVQNVRRLPLRIVVGALLLLGTGQLAWQAYRASYTLADDPHNPYVYAQTSADAVRLAEQLQELAAASDQGDQMPIQVIWSDAYYWPLPWYFRRFGHVEWWTTLPADVTGPVVVCAPQYDAELTTRLGDTYIMTGYFQLRPQVLAQLWVRDALWEQHLRRLGRI
ncbi:MAG: flippase activity-associated protein Agl23 [Pirellulaceae bacterium]